MLEGLEKETLTAGLLGERVFVPYLDLGDLESVERCAKELLSNCESIDSLVLNAGLQYTGSSEARFSAQGFELTFAVNHLGHQVLTQYLIPLLDKGFKPRVVITSSEVHNPTSSGGRIGSPAHLGSLELLGSVSVSTMNEKVKKFDADKAYKDSKLCNVLFARELAKRLFCRNTPMPVIAWAPGLVIPRTDKGFFRHSRRYNELGQRMFSFVARDLLRITESPEKAGRILKDLAINSDYNSDGFNYYSNRLVQPGIHIFKSADISEEASDDSLAKRLWDKSASFAKLPSSNGFL
mgnify:CR=1 FL=1